MGANGVGRLVGKTAHWNQPGAPAVLSVLVGVRVPPTTRSFPLPALCARNRLSSPRRPVVSPPLKTAAAIQSLRVATKATASFAAALAFLLFTFLSVSSLHEASHHNDHGQSAEHACVMCALAKSQVTGAEPAPVVTPLAIVAAPTTPSLVVRLELPAADRSLPPGRAPPVV